MIKKKLDKKELEEKYLELKTVKQTAEYFCVSKSTIEKYFREYNINCSKIFGTRGQNRRKYVCDDNFFAQDNELSFYIAGFIAADGCIHHTSKNGYNLSINLSTKDIKFLININDILKSNKPIHSYKNEYNGASVLHITSKKICDDLKRFNIVPAKSLIYTFPDWLI